MNFIESMENKYHVNYMIINWSSSNKMHNFPGKQITIQKSLTMDEVSISESHVHLLIIQILPVQ